MQDNFVETKGFYRPVPLAALKREQVDYYWQSIIAHDLLKYRIPEIKEPRIQHVYQMLGAPFNVCFNVLDETTDLPCAEFMLTNFQGQSALIHFSIHPDFHGKQAVQMAVEATDWLLSLYRKDAPKTPYVTSIIGLTPISNRLACRFIRKVGFEPQVTIPKSYYLAYADKYDDGVLSLKVRKDG